MLTSRVRAIDPDFFATYPLNEMMEAGIVYSSRAEAAYRVSQIAARPEITANPAVIAGLWLYADDLDASHRVSQTMDSALGAWWHGIMHRREGDYANARYWLARARSHRKFGLIVPNPYYVVELAENGDRRLTQAQREEWVALMEISLGDES